LSYESLKDHGNMSSVSVINVLERSINHVKKKSKCLQRYGMMLAMGPAFCSEIVLVKEI